MTWCWTRAKTDWMLLLERTQQQWRQLLLDTGLTVFGVYSARDGVFEGLIETEYTAWLWQPLSRFHSCLPSSLVFHIPCIVFTARIVDSFWSKGMGNFMPETLSNRFLERHWSLHVRKSPRFAETMNYPILTLLGLLIKMKHCCVKN